MQQKSENIFGFIRMHRNTIAYLFHVLALSVSQNCSCSRSRFQSRKSFINNKWKLHIRSANQIYCYEHKYNIHEIH